MGIPYAERATQYAHDVVAKKVIVSRWVRLACQRHLDDLCLSDSRWQYDSARVHKVCTFAERMRHEKGSLQGQRIVLHDAQVFVLASIFGWVDSAGIRKYRQALIMLPRGQGKSPLSAIIALYCAFFDGEPGAEVYCGANTEKQALEVFRPAKAMCEQEPDFSSRFGVTAAAKSIFQLRTRARFQPVVRKPGDGASIWLGILDELHEAQDSTLYDTFITGLNKRPGSLLLVISTAGVQSLENPCLALQRKGEQVLDGTIQDDRLFVLIHCADPDVDWTSPAAVEMANPLLGISNDREAILLDQQEAVRNPGKANVFRAKHLNQWSSASSAWMNMPMFNACADSNLTPDDCKHLPCVIGCDLASKLDLAALTLLFRDDSKGPAPHYYCFTKAYLPESRVNDPALQHYARWAAQGAPSIGGQWLTGTPGSELDYSQVERDALAWIAKYQVREIVYDPSHAGQWGQRVSEQSGLPRVEALQRGYYLSPAMKEAEASIYAGRFHFDGNPVFSWCMSNVLTRELPGGEYVMPDKPTPEAKLDCAVSLFIAMTRAMVLQPEIQGWAFAPFLA